MTVAVWVAACSSSSVPAVGTAAFDPQSCLANWRSVYTGGADEGPPDRDWLAWRSGMLFAGRSAIGFDHTWVFAIPDHGGPKTLLYEGGDLLGFWVVGDKVLYALENELFEVPQAGGAPRAVLRYAEGLDANRILDRALDDTGLYWLYDAAHPAVYRRARSEGDEVRLAEVPRAGAPLWIIGDRLLVRHGFLGIEPLSAATLPKTGGAVTVLPAYGRSSSLFGVSRAGALLWVRSGESAGGGSRPYGLARGDIGGTAPQPFSTSLPATAIPYGAWAAGDGAWYLALIEATDPRTHYLSAWYLTSDGSARRLACMPTPEIGDISAEGDRIDAAVAGDGALYVVRGGPGLGWAIVAADNPGAPAEPLAPGQ